MWLDWDEIGNLWAGLNTMVIKKVISLTSGKSTQRWLYSGCLGSLLPALRSLGMGSMLNMISQSNKDHTTILFSTRVNLVEVLRRGEGSSYKSIRASSHRALVHHLLLCNLDLNLSTLYVVHDTDWLLSFNLAFPQRDMPNIPEVLELTVFATESPWGNKRVCDKTDKAPNFLKPQFLWLDFDKETSPRKEAWECQGEQEHRSKPSEKKKQLMLIFDKKKFNF